MKMQAGPCLVLNCAEGDLQVIMGIPGRVDYFQSFNVPGRAMKYMAEAIDRGLKFLDLAPMNIAGIACVTGPGSFTGIRMSLAHALGLSCARCTPLAGISYLRALALGPGALLKGTLWVLVHSRKNQVYAQGFSVPDLSSLCPALDISAVDIESLISRHPEPGYLLGSGVRRNREHFNKENLSVLPLIWDTAMPLNLLKLAFEAEWSEKLPAPAYLRASEAEENLERIAGQRGLDPALARKILDE